MRVSVQIDRHRFQLGVGLHVPVVVRVVPEALQLVPHHVVGHRGIALGDGGGQGASADLKTFTLEVDQTNLAIISGRLQPGGKSGFWLVTNSKVLKSSVPKSVGRELTVAWGWAPTFEAAVAAHVKLQSANLGSAGRKVAGLLAESEAPLPGYPAAPFLFDSLSLAQLINFYQPVQARDAFDKYLIVQPAPGTNATAGLETIVVANAPSTPLENVNWLSAFYAIEWSVFAGFAVFMWWRLVEDERLRRNADAEAQVQAEQAQLAAD